MEGRLRQEVRFRAHFSLGWMNNLNHMN
jgi:hypothetical protein